MNLRIFLQRIVHKCYHIIRKTFVFLQYFFCGKKADYILIDTPVHGNLGDQAIALAEMQLLEEIGKSYFEVTAEDINGLEKLYAYVTSPCKSILLHGGGFLGSVWPAEELRFRRILESFKNNRIVVFPQTVSFDLSSESGRAFYEDSLRVYSAHPKLTVFLREHKSQFFLQEYFPRLHVMVVPDIVLSLSYKDLKKDAECKNRKGIILLFRHDVEKFIEEQSALLIKNLAVKLFPDDELSFTDTVISSAVYPHKRKQAVLLKLDEIASVKLVITDRLHGMIFCAVTGTPCIALNNSTGKVSAVYEWIKHCEYIRFAHNVDEVKEILSTFDFTRAYTFDKNLMHDYFLPLVSELREEKAL